MPPHGGVLCDSPVNVRASPAASPGCGGGGGGPRASVGAEDRAFLAQVRKLLRAITAHVGDARATDGGAAALSALAELKQLDSLLADAGRPTVASSEFQREKLWAALVPRLNSHSTSRSVVGDACARGLSACKATWVERRWGCAEKALAPARGVPQNFSMIVNNLLAEQGAVWTSKLETMRDRLLQAAAGSEEEAEGTEGLEARYEREWRRRWDLAAPRKDWVAYHWRLDTKAGLYYCLSYSQMAMAMARIAPDAQLSATALAACLAQLEACRGDRVACSGAGFVAGGFGAFFAEAHQMWKERHGILHEQVSRSSGAEKFNHLKEIRSEQYKAFADAAGSAELRATHSQESMRTYRVLALSCFDALLSHGLQVPARAERNVESLAKLCVYQGDDTLALWAHALLYRYWKTRADAERASAAAAARAQFGAAASGAASLLCEAGCFQAAEGWMGAAGASEENVFARGATKTVDSVSLNLERTEVRLRRNAGNEFARRDLLSELKDMEEVKALGNAAANAPPRGRLSTSSASSAGGGGGGGGGADDEARQMKADEALLKGRALLTRVCLEAGNTEAALLAGEAALGSFFRTDPMLEASTGGSGSEQQRRQSLLMLQHMYGILKHHTEALLVRGEVNPCERLLSQALKVQACNSGSFSPLHTAWLMYRRGQGHAAEHKFADARECLQSAIKVIEALIHPGNHTDLRLRCYLLLGECCLRTNDPLNAHKVAARAEAKVLPLLKVGERLRELRRPWTSVLGSSEALGLREVEFLCLEEDEVVISGIPAVPELAAAASPTPGTATVDEIFRTIDLHEHFFSRRGDSAFAPLPPTPRGGDDGAVALRPSNPNNAYACTPLRRDPWEAGRLSLAALKAQCRLCAERLRLRLPSEDATIPSSTPCSASAAAFADPPSPVSVLRSVHAARLADVRCAVNARLALAEAERAEPCWRVSRDDADDDCGVDVDVVSDTAVAGLKKALDECGPRQGPSVRGRQVGLEISRRVGRRDEVACAHYLNAAGGWTVRRQLEGVRARRGLDGTAFTGAWYEGDAEGSDAPGAPSSSLGWARGMEIDVDAEEEEVGGFDTRLQCGGVHDAVGYTERLRTLLPRSLAVVTLSLNRDGRLVLSRVESEVEPVVVGVPDSAGALNEATAALAKTLADAKKHLQGVDASRADDSDYKREWWGVRESLDARVKGVLEKLGDDVLHGWRGLLLGCPQDAGVAARLEAIGEEVAVKLEAVARGRGLTGRRVDPKVLRLLLSSVPKLYDGLRVDAVRKKGKGPEGEDLYWKATTSILYHMLHSLLDVEPAETVSAEMRAIARYIHESVASVMPLSRPVVRQHVMLVLGSLNSLPWESCSALEGEPVSRIPSVHYLLHKLETMSCREVLTRNIDPSKVFYVLNPDGNLNKTAARFEWFTQEKGWRGQYGALPGTVNQGPGIGAQAPRRGGGREWREKWMSIVGHGLSHYDTFLYLGHGTGEQFVAAKDVRSVAYAGSKGLKGGVLPTTPTSDGHRLSLTRRTPRRSDAAQTPRRLFCDADEESSPEVHPSSARKRHCRRTPADAARTLTSPVSGRPVPPPLQRVAEPATASASAGPEQKAVCFLMGCSSGSLTAGVGEIEPYGIAYAYLVAGAPAVVANLWDVTDGEIDRFTAQLLKTWLAEANSMPLSECLNESRGHVKLRYLIGACPVHYGLPINPRLA